MSQVVFLCLGRPSASRSVLGIGFISGRFRGLPCCGIARSRAAERCRSPQRLSGDRARLVYQIDGARVLHRCIPEQTAQTHIRTLTHTHRHKDIYTCICVCISCKYIYTCMYESK